ILQTSPGPYFDGDFSLQDGTTAWSGTPGESPSSETVDLGSEVVVWENYAIQAQATSSSFGRFSTGTGGDYDIAWLTNQADGPLPEITNYARVTAVTPATSGSGGWNDHNIESSRAPLEGSAGDTVTMSIWMRYTGSLETYTVYFRVYAYSGTSSEHSQQSFDIPSGEWVRLSHTITPEESYDSVGFWAYFTGGDDIDAGGTIDVTGKMVTKGEHLLHYFDETFSPDPDLTPEPRPGGGSQLVGQEVAGMTPTNGVVVKSSQWSKSGGVSARFITTSEATGNNLPIGIVGVFGSPVGGVVVWRRQDAPIGELEFPTGASNLSILTGTGDASAPAVNAPGETLMRVELGEIAPLGVQVYLPGGGNVGESVWFDILTVTDESYDGPPFSGSSPTEGPKWLPGSGNSGCKFIGNPTWIANSGVNGGQIGYAATLKEVGDWQQ
ncbi:MAG TPA: hypothetical protein VK054_01300, partial [Beutenbergiaceae bacterium]|nr:hypothetical protein [Beutenbergiaceae bacterium]